MSKKVAVREKNGITRIEIIITGEDVDDLIRKLKKVRKPHKKEQDVLDDDDKESSSDVPDTPNSEAASSGK